MLAKNVLVAGFAVVVIIAIVLMLAGSPIVAENDQPSAASMDRATDGHYTRRSDSHLGKP